MRGLFLFSLLLPLCLAGSNQGKNNQRPHFAHEDPNSQYVCEGQLSDYAACQCRTDIGELACINAQFVDTDVFLHVNNHYKHMQKITFHGNNFQDLPSQSLFGSTTHSNLDTLNISANYIVNLNSNALKGLPNLRVLDLSNNEIVLKADDVNFLTHTPHLTELYLRRAFTATINRTVQFQLMMRMFETAKLDKLKILDLSYNYLANVPYALACPFPSITTLDLRQNFLRTLALNATCMSKVHMLDLSRNQFNTLDASLRTLIDKLPSNSVRIKNYFFCDCNSKDYITWIRSTDKIRDKNGLTCDRASPKNYLGARLVEVPVHKLDCSVDLNANGAVQLSSIIAIFLIGVIAGLRLY